MKKITLTEINNDTFNPFDATWEELIANAISEAGLIGDLTRINDIIAKEYCNSFREKRIAYIESTKIGCFFVKKGLINQVQLEEALAFQMQNREIKLGEILVDMQICNKEDVNSILSMQTTMRICI